MAGDKQGGGNKISVVDDGQTPVGQLVAVMQAGGVVGNAIVARNLSNGLFGERFQPSTDDMAKVVAEIASRARSGEMGDMVDVLSSQVVAVNAMFARMMGKATENMGHHLEATDRYFRLAMKAQAQTRATVETLAKMLSPREQIVKHIHIDNRNGQAVIAENVQRRGNGIGENDTQPRAIDAPCPPVPCSDPFGEAVPVASRPG